MPADFKDPHKLIDPGSFYGDENQNYALKTYTSEISPAAMSIKWIN